MLRNPFERRTEKDKNEALARLAASNEAYNAAIQKARKCLESPLFKEANTAAQKSIIELVEVMLALPVTDPIEYAFKMNSLTIQINALRHLGMSIAEVANLPERPAVKAAQPAKETVAS